MTLKKDSLCGALFLLVRKKNKTFPVFILMCALGLDFIPYSEGATEIHVPQADLQASPEQHF